ncbi:flagellar basal body-associated FliL family protein [uncultured Amphritea sp.]|uniref:flagellar basal body-associated FliL family protein n=1 Tax=uncultured Amphritea sp. TaxID=981605 RepID=UPI00260FE4D7|nr:flagellar basal body-associated FliL family protein [uncultured Amphritea sp.]
MAEDTTDTGEAGAKKSGKLKLILIIVAGVVLAAGIGGGVAMFLMGGSDTEVAADSAAPAKPAQALYTKIRTLEGSPYFTVVVPSNDGRTHYMQLYVEAKSREAEVDSALTKHMPKIVSNLNQLFSRQSFDALRTPSGKMMLQQEALVALQEVMQEKIGKPGVEKVLFTGFIMQ